MCNFDLFADCGAAPSRGNKIGSSNDKEAAAWPRAFAAVVTRVSRCRCPICRLLSKINVPLSRPKPSATAGSEPDKLKAGISGHFRRGRTPFLVGDTNLICGFEERT